MTVKIAVDASGAGEPFVLLHGLGASRRLWHRAAPLLVASGRRVLAPDLPGFGDSPPAGPGFEFAAVTDALAGALRRRARGPFDLLGSSLGGAVALQFALALPRAGAAPGAGRARRVSRRGPGRSPPWPGALAEPALAVRRIAGRPLSVSPTARRALLWGAVAEPERLSRERRAADPLELGSRDSAGPGAGCGAPVRSAAAAAPARGSGRSDLGRARPGGSDHDARCDPGGAAGRGGRDDSRRGAHPAAGAPGGVRGGACSAFSSGSDEYGFLTTPSDPAASLLCRDIEPNADLIDRARWCRPAAGRSIGHFLGRRPGGRVPDRLLPRRHRVAAVADAGARPADRAAVDPLPDGQPPRVRRLGPESRDGRWSTSRAIWGT